MRVYRNNNNNMYFSNTQVYCMAAVAIVAAVIGTRCVVVLFGIFVARRT